MGCLSPEIHQSCLEDIWDRKITEESQREQTKAAMPSTGIT